MTRKRNKNLNGGIIHTDLGYNPRDYPMPTAAAPDMVGPAFEHMLAYGSLEHLSAEELAALE